MPTILGANSVSGGYEISNSLRFNDGDSPRLSFTPDSGGDRDTFTFSFWFKRGVLGTNQRLFSAGPSLGTSNDNISSVRIESNDQLKIFGEISGSVSFTLQTNRVFRDPSAWYHIVYAFNTEDGTAANRIKLYVNGVQETSFATATYMSQNTDTFFNATNVHNINYTGSNYADGYISEFHSIDGTQVAPTEFGEVDDNGVWIPKAYEGAYGTNGFYLQFKQTGTGTDASGMGADTSGNTHHFAPTNLTATDVTTDTPTNNFATMNPLYLRTSGAPVFSEGNTFSDQSASNTLQFSTILVTQGKWYMEVKVVAVGGLAAVGISDPSIYDNGNPDTKIISYRNNGQKKNLGTASSYGNTFTTGDIIGIAFDADDGEIFFYKNGTAENSGTAAFTGIDTSSGYVIGSIGYNGEASNNYGNPSYTISSGNADANGYGNFEYAPPSGYYSLCTKNLGEFG